MRLHSFDYFRGLAIVFIVAGHSYGPWVAHSFFEKIVASLISGGTTFFVFISGFFFHHIFYPKFRYKSFIIKKAANVLLPYSILSVAAFICLVLFLNDPPFAEVFITDHKPESGLQYLKLFTQYWWTGSLLTAYWYVPFIMIIFALSPVFIKQIELPIKSQLGLFFMLLCLATLIQRPMHNLSPIHSVIYFCPVYMLGIVCSIQKERLFKFLAGKTFVLGSAVVLMSVVQLLIYGNDGNFNKDAIFSFNGIDTMILQKILMCFFLLAILQQLENKEIFFLKHLASTSFAIYFLHPWALYFLYKSSFIDHVRFLPGFLIFLLTVTLVITVCLATAALFKWLLGEKSRFVIGW